MAEPTLKQKVELELKKKGLNYKVTNLNADVETESITFIDAYKGSQIHGKIIRSFTEGEVKHWPALKHENLAPLIDVLCIRNDLYVYLTIDPQITLKEIVHDDVFVYDPGCFDKKRSFARGILSGLAYLHVKSLCLMNLCDNNIVISESGDRAVITNFSNLICSYKVSRPKMNVPAVYKAPESEMEEFDVIAAEIWASGVLMLDMFLAHMVPWAVVDYEPKRVAELVDGLPVELLQAANAGSRVTVSELAKLKYFLKCFFEQDPLSRIPIRYNSIAPFCRLNLEPSLYLNVLSVEDTFLSTNNHPKKIKIENVTPSSPNFGNINYQTLKNHYELEQTKKDLTMSVKPTSNTKSLTYNGAASIPSTKSGNEDSNLDIISNASATDIRQASPSHAGTNMNKNKLEKRDGITYIPSSVFYNRNIFVSETSFNLPKNIKSIQRFKQTGDANPESNFNSYQSKSLPFIQNIVPLQFYSNGASFPNIRLSSLKQSNEDDSEIQGLCLDRLSEDGDSVEDIECTNSAREINLSKSLNPCEVIDKRQSMPKSATFKLVKSPLKILENPENDFERFPRNTYFSLNKSDILGIIDKIAFLTKCHINSVLWHQRTFTSSAFAQKIHQLLTEYRNLLHKENPSLREALRKEYGLTQVLNLENFKVKDYGNQFINSTTNQHQCNLEEREFVDSTKTKNEKADFGNVENNFEDTIAGCEFREIRFVEPRKTNISVKADFGNSLHNPHKLEDATTPKYRRMYSYSYASETTANNLRSEKVNKEFNANISSVGSKSGNKPLEQSAKAGRMTSVKNLTRNLEKPKIGINTNIPLTGCKSCNKPPEQSEMTRKLTLKKNTTGNLENTKKGFHVTISSRSQSCNGSKPRNKSLQPSKNAWEMSLRNYPTETLQKTQKGFNANIPSVGTKSFNGPLEQSRNTGKTILRKHPTANLEKRKMGFNTNIPSVGTKSRNGLLKQSANKEKMTVSKHPTGNLEKEKIGRNTNMPSVATKSRNGPLEQSANTGKTTISKHPTGNLEKGKVGLNTNISSVGTKSRNRPLEQSANTGKTTLSKHPTGNLEKGKIGLNTNISSVGTKSRNRPLEQSANTGKTTLSKHPIGNLEKEKIGLKTNMPSVGTKSRNGPLEQSANTGKTTLSKHPTINLEKGKIGLNTNISSVGTKSRNRPLEQSANTGKTTLRKQPNGNLKKRRIILNTNVPIVKTKTRNETHRQTTKTRKATLRKYPPVDYRKRNIGFNAHIPSVGTKSRNGQSKPWEMTLRQYILGNSQKTKNLKTENYIHYQKNRMFNNLNEKKGKKDKKKKKEAHSSKGRNEKAANYKGPRREQPKRRRWLSILCPFGSICG